MYDSKPYAICQSYKTLSICKKYLAHIILEEDNSEHFIFCLSELKHFKSYKMYEQDNTIILITEYFLCP